MDASTRHLIELAKIIYSLATTAHDKNMLMSLKSIALGAARLFDDAEDVLHPDLGTNLLEYVLLRLDDANAQQPPSGSTLQYEKVVKTMLKEIEARISTKTRS